MPRPMRLHRSLTTARRTRAICRQDRRPALTRHPRRSTQHPIPTTGEPRTGEHPHAKWLRLERCRTRRRRDPHHARGGRRLHASPHPAPPTPTDTDNLDPAGSGRVSTHAVSEGGRADPAAALASADRISRWPDGCSRRLLLCHRPRWPGSLASRLHGYPREHMNGLVEGLSAVPCWPPGRTTSRRA